MAVREEQLNKNVQRGRLRVHDLLADLYFCSPTELPSDFVGLKIGKLVKDDDVEDWMILEAGTLYGSFSLRVIREQIPASERAAFERIWASFATATKTPHNPPMH